MQYHLHTQHTGTASGGGGHARREGVRRGGGAGGTEGRKASGSYVAQCDGVGELEPRGPLALRLHGSMGKLKPAKAHSPASVPAKRAHQRPHTRSHMDCVESTADTAWVKLTTLDTHHHT